MRKHLGHVERVEAHDPDSGNQFERYADVSISYPDINFSRDIPALLITAFGKISSDS